MSITLALIKDVYMKNKSLATVLIAMLVSTLPLAAVRFIFGSMAQGLTGWLIAAGNSKEDVSRYFAIASLLVFSASLIYLCKLGCTVVAAASLACGFPPQFVIFYLAPKTDTKSVLIYTILAATIPVFVFLLFNCYVDCVSTVKLRKQESSRVHWQARIFSGSVSILQTVLRQ